MYSSYEAQLNFDQNTFFVGLREEVMRESLPAPGICIFRPCGCDSTANFSLTFSDKQDGSDNINILKFKCVCVFVGKVWTRAPYTVNTYV